MQRVHVRAIHRVVIVMLAACSVAALCGCLGPAASSSLMTAREAAERTEAALARAARERVDFDAVEARRLLDELATVQPFLRDAALSRRLELVSTELRDATAEPRVVQEIADLEADIRASMRARRYSFGDGRYSIGMLQRELDGRGSDGKRRDVWMALGPGWNDLARQLRRLIDRRIVLAVGIGYQGGEAQRSRAIAELDPDLVDDILEDIWQATRGLATADSSRRPWMIPIEEEMPFGELLAMIPQADAAKAARRLFLGMGFDAAAVSAVLEAELGRVAADRFADTGALHGMLSRCGREIYEQYVPFEPREFARPASTALEAAIGRLFGDFARDEGWLRLEFPQLFGDSERRRDRGNAAVLELLYLAARVEFEREAYRNPGRDLDELWWNLGEKWMSVKRVEGVAAWARDRGLVATSFRARDELLARVLAAQLERYLIVAHGGLVGVSNTADFLRERIFRRGASAPWSDIFTRAVAEPPNAIYYLSDVLDGMTRETLEAWLERQDRRERARNEGQMRRSDRRDRIDRRELDPAGSDTSTDTSTDDSSDSEPRGT